MAWEIGQDARGVYLALERRLIEVGENRLLYHNDSGWPVLSFDFYQSVGAQVDGVPLL